MIRVTPVSSDEHDCVMEVCLRTHISPLQSLATDGVKGSHFRILNSGHDLDNDKFWPEPR